MTLKEQKKRAANFVKATATWTDEKQYDQKFWNLLLSEVFDETDVTNYIDYQYRVTDVDGNMTTKFADAYIPSTKVLIEQKSTGKDLEEAWRQAKSYYSNTPSGEINWIVVCDFKTFVIYDMKKTGFPKRTIYTRDLERDFDKLQFLVDKSVVELPSRELEISKQAGEIIGQIYEALLAEYKGNDKEEIYKNLNKLCVRLVFCFYAEDAGLFYSKNQFHDYMKQFKAEHWQMALEQLFKVLDTKVEDRSKNLKSDLAIFPYVNGGLFNGDIEMPEFTDEIVKLIIDTASSNFDWSEISPTIFGAMFESTLNQETRRQGGMHYTSIENIHKVIDPLFLDDLKNRLEGIKTFSDSQRTRALRSYQDYLASLKFLDPACGSGNFLTESYLSIRRLENEVLSILQKDQIVLDDFVDVKVSINQFYGIEINDFAVSVAMTALWIAESQMFEESQRILHGNKEFLPLTTNVNIHEGNALQLDWDTVIQKSKLNYIMGNPPFLGYGMQSEMQKRNLAELYVHKDGRPYNASGKIDYVAGWYWKSAYYMQNTKIKTAFVSTNSITQGDQVFNVWQPLYEQFDIHIDFAHRTFRWDNEATDKAKVHCVIIGFSESKDQTDKFIFDGETKIKAANISPYIVDAPNILISSRSNPICSVKKMTTGNRPADGGHLIIEAEDYADFIKKEPSAEKYIKQLTGAEEYINNEKRYCLWLVNVSPSEIASMPEVLKRVEKCRDARMLGAPDRQKLAKTPTLFRETKNPDNYIIVPATSSETRKYIPIGFLDGNTISTNSATIIENADLYDFGVLTSSTHMSWMRAVAGRLKSDYRYSAKIVYNNFIWCEPTKEQKNKIEKTAQAILDARNNYPNCSLADMYGENMYLYADLVKAHEENDKAVWEAYGKAWKFGNEAECVAYLMRLYERKAQEVK